MYSPVLFCTLTNSHIHTHTKHAGNRKTPPTACASSGFGSLAPAPPCAAAVPCSTLYIRLCVRRERLLPTPQSGEHRIDFPSFDPPRDCPPTLADGSVRNCAYVSDNTAPKPPHNSIPQPLQSAQTTTICSSSTSATTVTTTTTTTRKSTAATGRRYYTHTPKKTRQNSEAIGRRRRLWICAPLET